MKLEYKHKEPESSSDQKPPLLLLLHGIGADENDLFGIHPFLDKRFFIVSARAPFALPYGGYGWFEIYMEPGSFSINGQQFEESRAKILAFVDELIAEHDLDTARIYLCGFSQGAMMSLSALFSEPEKFAGVVAMSGRAVAELAPTGADTEKLKEFPILVTHGTNDPVLPIENGRATKEILSRLPVDLEYHEYQMGHEISQESLEVVSNWLSKRLGG